MPETPGAEAASTPAQPSEAAQASKVFETIAGSQPADEQTKEAAPPATGQGITQGPQKTRIPVEHLQGNSDQREAAVVARRALERDGWDPKTIDSLPLETVLSVGAKARERQSDIDRKINKARELEDEYQALRAERGDTDEEESLGDPDLDELRAINPELAERIAGRQAEAEQRLTEVQVERAEREFRGTIVALQADYPELSDPSVEAKVFARVAKLARNGEFDDIPPGPERLRRAVESAVAIELDQSPRTMAQQRLIQRGDFERNGQPDTGREQGRDIPEDLESWAMAELRRGRKADSVNEEFLRLRAAQKGAVPGRAG